MAAKSYINFAGNDYLGLASHPALLKALYQGAKTYGISSTSSRWALGWTDLHQKLEDREAKFTGLEAACILNSTYLGGAVYYGVMASRCKTVVCDEMVHSNQYLGMRAAGLNIVKFKHLDMDDMRKKIKGLPQAANQILATDGVYGISGEIAPVKEMSDLAKYYDMELFVDDAHGFGVYGKNGRGVLEYDNVYYQKTTLLASMSKAAGVNGGFLAGRLDIMDACRRSAICSGTAIPPPPIASASLKSLEIISEEPERRTRLFALAEKMRKVLKDAGFECVVRNSVIIAIVCKDEFEAAKFADHFLKHGLRIPYFKYASEPRQNLLRAVARSIYRNRDIKTFAGAVSTFKR
jgi:7-keto-8-aminopelargonate synthetase-like enzyme